MRSRKRKNVKSVTPNSKGDSSSRRKYRSSVSRPGTLTGLLYHSPVSRNAWLTLALLVAQGFASVAPAVGAGPSDRLERFRELASTRLAAPPLDASVRFAEDERKIYALLDEEIVENLASGGLFASAGFLADRLDGFVEAWGGAAFRVMRVGPLVIVACHLDEGGADSVRVYGARAGEV